MSEAEERAAHRATRGMADRLPVDPEATRRQLDQIELHACRHMVALALGDITPGGKG